MAINYKFIRTENEYLEVLEFFKKNKFGYPHIFSAVRENFCKRYGYGVMASLDDGNIVGAVLLLHQNSRDISGKEVECINYTTLFTDKNFRNVVPYKMYQLVTKTVGSDFAITNYTPVGSVSRMMRKLGYSKMSSFRYILLPSISSLWKRNIFSLDSKIPPVEIPFNIYFLGKKKRKIWAIPSYTSRNFLFIKLKIKYLRVICSDSPIELNKVAKFLPFYALRNFGCFFVTLDSPYQIKPYRGIKIESKFYVKYDNTTDPIWISPINSEIAL